MGKEQTIEDRVKEIHSITEDILWECEKGKTSWEDGLRQLKAETVDD